MQAQNLSYKVKNKILTIGGIDISFEVFTFDNVFSLNSINKEENTYTSNELMWGDSEIVDSSFKLIVNEEKNKHILKASACIEKENVRCFKFKFHNAPLGTLINSIDCDHEITEFGFNMTYPEAWRSVSTPLWVFKTHDNKYFYVRSLAKKVNEHRIYLKKIDAQHMILDLVYEQDAQVLKNNIETPELEFGYINDPDEIYGIQSEYIEKTYSLKPFWERDDVPSWFKDISLCVNMHMEAYTGHIFHTYEKALEDIKKLCKHIDGKHILVYIPGWEGRYYFKYGMYTPDNRLGGAKKLKEMVDGMHALGCKVMAMYGINMVNRNTKDYDKWGLDAECVTAGGGSFKHGSVDWDGAHHYGYEDLANCNIGNPKYQDYMFDQIKKATEEFGFDGAFLDIAGYWVNDRKHHIADGVNEFTRRLKALKPDFLVAGECYYDGIGPAFPLFQSGHTDGSMNYHDRVSEKLFTKYCRNISHLCLGDFDTLSSGVHELGQNTDVVAPYREGIIPTLCLVEDTLDNCFDKVLEVLETSKKYKEEFLK